MRINSKLYYILKDHLGSASVVTNPANSRLNLSYSYFANGNVQQTIDSTRSETLNYTYDELDRLDTVSGPYSMDYNYNTIGNITSKDATTYTYGDTTHKHAATSLSGSGGTYTYDANGNMITRVEGGLTYTQMSPRRRLRRRKPPDLCCSQRANNQFHL